MTCETETACVRDADIRVPWTVAIPAVSRLVGGARVEISKYAALHIGTNLHLRDSGLRARVGPERGEGGIGAL